MGFEPTGSIDCAGCGRLTMRADAVLFIGSKGAQNAYCADCALRRYTMNINARENEKARHRHAELRAQAAEGGEGGKR